MKSRVFIVVIGIGIGMEIMAMLMHSALQQNLITVIPVLGLSHPSLIGATALFGFLGTALLVWGSMRLLYPLSLSRTVAVWAYATAVCFIAYKGLDVAYSLEMFSFAALFNTNFDINRLALDLLLVSSAVMLLVTMMCALVDLHKTKVMLEKRNCILDQEIAEKRMLAAAIEGAEESIEITDAAGKLIYVNAAFERLMGFTKEEVFGHHWRNLACNQDDEAHYEEIMATIEEKNVWQGCLSNSHKNGVPITTDATIFMLRNETGAVTNYVVARQDVTREKMLEQQAQQSQKLEAIGTLAGGIAHDLNNVLAVIIGHSEISMARLEADHPVHKSFEVIMRTADRSSKLIKQLLVFSRQGVAEPGIMAPEPLVREQLKVIRSYLPSNIHISDAISSDIECILSEPVELQQMMFNLCTNANHAMQPQGGTLKIALKNIVIEREMPVATGLLAPGEYVHLSVCDTGCGMNATVVDRLFEPFFTTKEVGMGTGLGLTMVHGSIMRSGGAINVTSTPGEGTRFDLYWPKHICEATESIAEGDTPQGNGRRVLLVDDMADFKDLIEMNLAVHGFKTSGFTDTESALDYFRKNSQIIDIAVVDYMMPGMNGGCFAERLHEITPELPIVLLSGYSCGITEENAAEHGFSAVISKPVETSRLIRVLVQCLP